MKIQLYRRVALGLSLGLLPLLSGCETDEAGSAPGLLSAAVAEPVFLPAAAADIAPAVTKPEPPAATPTPPLPAESQPLAERAVPAGQPALPPSIRPSSPLAEIVKLAQSGVEKEVILTYVTNSSSTFGLGADEIVYLNDLGLPSDVITAIMEHDKAMKLFWANAQAQSQQAAAAPAAEAAPAEQTAVAPSYQNPPPAAPAPAEPQPANVTYNYFQETLSPYGSWVNVEGYGTCWQPSVVVVNPGWRPYCDGGRWIYSDAGWYWYSDYTWGWAPFHYGRWFSHPRWGWCWYPDYTWGPSWVTWRYNDGYCGWAPLPPAACYTTGVGFTYYGSSVSVSFGFGLGYSCYTFVPWNRVCNYRPSTYHAPRHQAKDIYHNSTVINNVINGNNNTIINNGVPVERVTAATKSDIKKVALRDASSTPTRGGRRERLESDGQSLAVHRPQIPQDSAVPIRAGRREPGEGRALAGEPAANTQTRQPDVTRSDRNAESRPAITRSPREPEVSPATGRNTVATDNSSPRPATPARSPRDSVAAQANPAKPAVAPEPRVKPIDVPSSRPIVRPTRSAPSENAASSGNRNAERSSTVPSLIVRGTERVNEPSANRPAAPQASAPQTSSPLPRSAAPSSSSSLVVIGKRDNAPSQPQVIAPAAQPEIRPVEPARPASRSSTVTATGERESVSRPAAPTREYSRPQPASPETRSAPSPDTSRPTFSAPAARPTAPSPSFTPRPAAPSPAPEISRPAPAAPAPRPQPSAPAVSAPRSAPAPAPAAPAARPQPSSSSGSSRPGNRNNN